MRSFRKRSATPTNSAAKCASQQRLCRASCAGDGVWLRYFTGWLSFLKAAQEEEEEKKKLLSSYDFCDVMLAEMNID